MTRSLAVLAVVALAGLAQAQPRVAIVAAADSPGGLRYTDPQNKLVGTGLFSAVEQHLGREHQALAARLAERLDPHLPAPWRSLPLSRKAVLSLLCAPISCVLVGMRQPGYVADMLSLREHPVRLLSAAAGAADLSAVASAFEPYAAR